MSSKRRDFSSYKSRPGKDFVKRFIKFLVTMFFLVTLIRSFIFTSVFIQGVSMSPAIPADARVFISIVTFGGYVPIIEFRLPGLTAPQRGDIVLVKNPQNLHRPWYIIAADPFVSFFTGNRVNLDNNNDNQFEVYSSCKRIVGLPGDSIRIQDGEIFIKRQNSSTFIREQESYDQEYEITDPVLPEGWSTDLFFSVPDSEFVLTGGEYFVLGDNRGSSTDSRHWGTVDEHAIVGKAVFMYWPFLKRL